MEYEIVDVFTTRRFAGNPLAVVLDAEELTGEQMQAIANEFHLSETAFVLPASLSGTDYRLRIFTPETELPFAGHPSVGSAWVLAQRGHIATGPVVQSCGAGLFSLTTTPAGGPVSLTADVLHAGQPLDPTPLLAAVGLTQADLAGIPPRRAGAGLDFVYLCVRDEAVAAAVPNPQALAVLPGIDNLVVFSIAADTKAPPSPPSSSARPPMHAARHIHARVFAGAVGVQEDPATGSAALGMGAWLVASRVAEADGASSFVIHQGAELRRPSLLALTVWAQKGISGRAQVTGNVVRVARGRLLLAQDLAV